MTERINAAVRHPYVNILAHPTTRKIGQRDPIQVDLDEVYAACAKAGTAIEIDAYPDRMDLNGPQARAAKNAGCTIAVDTDSHAKDHLAWMHFGVGTARRDRKSTRLNSSHSQISYAVFCLKKKK